MKKTLLAAATVMILSSAAYAQTSASTPAPAAAAAPVPTDGHSLRQKMTSDLQKAGFSDVQVMPESFLVHAKDSSGNPIMMVINPDSVSEVTSYTSNAPKTASTFSSVPQTDKLSSNMVGLDVYNTGNQDIGKIKDVAVGQDGVNAYILSVGGFLGMGDHYVAVNSDALKIAYNPGDKAWHATMNATADQLKAAPEFKYTGDRAANKM